MVSAASHSARMSASRGHSTMERRVQKCFGDFASSNATHENTPVRDALEILSQINRKWLNAAARGNRARDRKQPDVVTWCGVAILPVRQDDEFWRYRPFSQQDWLLIEAEPLAMMCAFTLCLKKFGACTLCLIALTKIEHYE